MSYQSNPDRTVEESYGGASANTSLLPSSGINTGASNSAGGEGTTTAELVTKFRRLNCGACLFVLLFHTSKIAFNPIRLTMLLSSPARLILESIVGLLALSLFLTESRIPVLGEKALKLARKIAVGESWYIDLDVARGRVLTLMIMGGSLGLINYLSRDGVSSGEDGGGDSSGELDAPSSNATDFGEDDASASDDATAHTHAFFIIFQCTIFSPATAVVLLLAAYTLHVLNTFPEYAESRAYSVQDGATGIPSASTGPSWVSNVGEVVQGSGYHNININV